MSLNRLTPSLARLVGLCLLLSASGTALAAQVDYFLKIPGLDGESIELPATGFEIRPFDEEPQAGLLLPAVQKVREAATRFQLARLACEDELLPTVIIESVGRGGGASLRIELSDVYVTSYSMRGGTGGGSEQAEAEPLPTEEVSFYFSRVKWTDLETGESFSLDCSSVGGCTCSR